MYALWIKANTDNLISPTTQKVFPHAVAHDIYLIVEFDENAIVFHLSQGFLALFRFRSPNHLQKEYREIARLYKETARPSLVRAVSLFRL